MLLKDGLGRVSAYEDPHLTINFHRHKAMLDGAALTLTRKEYELLALLSHNAGETVPRNALLRHVWGYGDGIHTRTLDVHIRRLRKKLTPFSDVYIETIFEVGYRFQPYRSRKTFDPPAMMALPAIA